MPRPRIALASIACALLLGVTACSPTDSDGPEGSAAPPSAAATDEPIFASDEEALAAAVEAHAAYTEASAQVASAGGEGAEAVSPFVSAEFDDAIQREFAALRESGLRMIGQNVYYNPRLDDRDIQNGGTRVWVIFCRDISGTRLVQLDGSDVTPDDRDLIQATRVEFIDSGEGGDLIVNRAERWQDEKGC
jgi:hypothetical protein